MYQDVSQWNEIRRRVLVDGLGKRAACREYGIHYKTLKKILTHPEPPGYRQQTARAKPKIGPFLGALQQIIVNDTDGPRKRRPTVRGIYYHLRDLGFTGSYSSVRDYLAEKRPITVDHGTVLSDIVDRPLRESRKVLQRLLQVPASDLSPTDLRAIREGLNRMRARGLVKTGAKGGEAPTRWMLRLLQCKEPESKIRAAVGEIEDLDALLARISHQGDS